MRPTGFSRYGGFGGQRFPIGFSGDTFQHELTLDWEISSTPLSANALCPWWSHDIGGFHANGNVTPPTAGTSGVHNATSGELYTRWLQFGAFSPLMRTHCGGCGPDMGPTCPCERRIWAWTTGHTPFMRDAFVLRDALVPYLYTAGRRAYDTGASPLRPLYHDYPSEPEAYAHSHEYAFGDDVLVAPVHTFVGGSLTAKTAVAVWLPLGVWTPWDGGSPPVESDGSITDTRGYGIGDVPAFVKSNALLPLAARVPGSSAASEASPAIAWTLWVQANACTPGNATLYEDDGVSTAHRAWSGPPAPAVAGVLLTHATFAWTACAEPRLAVSVTVHPSEGAYAGAPASRAHAVHVRGWASATAADATVVTVNGVVVPRGADAVPGWDIVPSGAGSLSAPVGALVVRAGNVPLTQSVVVTATTGSV